MFLYSEDDMKLTSIGMDGKINCWYYHTVNTANPPEKDRVIEMEPSFTITIEDSIGVSKIMGMCKINNDPNSYDYFIQVNYKFLNIYLKKEIVIIFHFNFRMVMEVYGLLISKNLKT